VGLNFGVINFVRGDNENHSKEPLKLVKAEDRNMHRLNIRVMDKDTGFGHVVLSPGQMIGRCLSNIVGCNILGALGLRAAMCCDMLSVVGSSFKMVKLEPTSPNMSQHIATRWRSACKMLRPTMFRYVALASCDPLAGALG